MVDLAFIAKVVASLAVVGIFYLLYEERKKPSFEQEIPGTRQSPLVITKKGLLVPIKKIALSPGKWQFFYNDNYSPVYYINDDYTDIIEVDNAQMLFGTERPVYIETDKLVELSYGHEHAATRKFLKQQLGAITQAITKNDFSKEEFESIYNDFRRIATNLSEGPGIVSDLRRKAIRAHDTSLKNESDLRAAEAGVEGRIQRRTDQLADVAIRRASSSFPEQ